MSICPITTAENSAWSRISSKDALHEASATLLANEFVNAFRAGDAMKSQVSTPGYNKPTMTLVDAIGDLFAGHDGDETLAELLNMVAAAARGETINARAAVFICQLAGKHAAFHAEDLAESLG